MIPISIDQSSSLDVALRRLWLSPDLKPATKKLSADAERIMAELGDFIIAEIPAFSESRNPDILPELARHGAAHTREILRLLDGKPIGDFEFVREHARRRADQRFPLEATLHAYRCGHRVFSRWMREAALDVSTAPGAQEIVAAVADFALEYTDAISTIAASEYVSQTRLLAEVDGDQRAELLQNLLQGHDESDGRVSRILRNAGYLDRRRSFCVALAQAVDPAEMLNPARARRLIDAIDRIMQGTAFHRLVDLRDNRVTIVFSFARRQSGWTPLETSFADRIKTELKTLGNAALIGISNDAPSTAHIPAAHREAGLALEMARVDHRVVQFSEIPIRRLLLHIAQQDVQRVLPAWSADFFTADDKARGALSATLRGYAGADMNVMRVAKELSLHPNTIYARLQRVADITGHDCRGFHALSEMLVVIECRR